MPNPTSRQAGESTDLFQSPSPKLYELSNEIIEIVWGKAGREGHINLHSTWTEDGQYHVVAKLAKLQEGEADTDGERVSLYTEREGEQEDLFQATGVTKMQVMENLVKAARIWANA